ncbi:hypothetical protein JOD54_005201 [Actinokineospora baliensis]|uniref:hypothetical protein n=1 Tax=Actinokineospora baliensis TaxID=547056 RepID=UPI00195D2E71|nr:hypothetical protein [Actinokineospora baliensis]MBM7774997.1 hypothetical protein [Actinokineospora baliensis]
MRTKRRLSLTSAAVIVLGLVTGGLLVLVGSTEAASATPQGSTTYVGFGWEAPGS